LDTDWATKLIQPAFLKQFIRGSVSTVSKMRSRPPWPEKKRGAACMEPEKKLKYVAA